MIRHFRPLRHSEGRKESNKVNADILKGKWRQMRGAAKQRWGKLTDSDLDRVEGKLDQLIGLVQERYGYTREQATQEVNRFIGEYSAQLRERTEHTLEQVEDKIAPFQWQFIVGAFVVGLVLVILLQSELWHNR
jgi:uncharacterized protein YjbJ (UPF0337 family)